MVITAENTTWTEDTCDSVGTEEHCNAIIISLIGMMNVTDIFSSMCDSNENVTYTYACPEGSSGPSDGDPNDMISYIYEIENMCQELSFIPANCGFLQTILHMANTDDNGESWIQGSCDSKYKQSSCPPNASQQMGEDSTENMLQFCDSLADIDYTIKCGSSASMLNIFILASITTLFLFY